MSSTNYPSTRKPLLFIVAGLIVFSLYLYYFVGIGDLLEALKNVNAGDYVFFYFLAICSTLLGLFFWAASWKTVLKILSVNLKMTKAFLFFWSGYFLDLLVPSETIGGEITRLYLTHHETQRDLGSIAASAIVNRLLEYLIVAVGLSTSVVILFLNYSLPNLVSGFMILVLVGTLIYLIILLFLALNKRAAEIIAFIGIKLLRILRLKKSAATEENTKASLEIFYDGFRTFRQNPKWLVIPIVFQLSWFFFNYMVYVLVFDALGYQGVSFSFLIVVYFIASSIQGATASLSVGSLDIILSQIFVLFGLSVAESGVAVVVLRSVTFWFPLLFGYVVAQVVGARTIFRAESRKKLSLSN